MTNITSYQNETKREKKNFKKLQLHFQTFLKSASESKLLKR